MSVRNLDKLFQPRSIALAAASFEEGSAGAALLCNLRRGGFTGPVMPLHPERRAIDGVTVYPDAASLPEAPDLALLASPPETAPRLIAELGARGARAAVLFGGGLATQKAADAALRQTALDAARPYLLRLIGPDSIGVMLPRAGLDASLVPVAALPGDLALVSQSGAMIAAVLDWARPRGIGFSHVVSLGGTIDVDFGDMLDYLAAEAGVRAILLYVELIAQARKFMSAARAAARGKPVLALKPGRFGAAEGADRVYDAAFRRAGLLRAKTMTELFDAVETLALTRDQRGDRLAILTNGRGPAALAADALSAQGGRLALLSPATLAGLDGMMPAGWSGADPVDLTDEATAAHFAAALTAILDDPEADAVLVLNSPTRTAPAAAAGRAVIDAVAASRPARDGRNVYTAWLGAETAGEVRRLFAAAHIPSYDTPDDGVRGFMHRVLHRRSRDMLMHTPAARSGDFTPDAGRAAAAIKSAIHAGRDWLEAGEAAEVLAAYDIPLPAVRLAADASAAAACAVELGGRVALKIRSPDLRHKSDHGGVVLDLDTPQRVEREALAMRERIALARPDARIDGFLVQEMVRIPGAVELLLGLSVDRVFGPVVRFGQGGAAAELLDDVSLELPPLNLALAEAQMARTRVWRLLRGEGSRPAAANPEIAEILVRLGQLGVDHPDIRELEINPLLAGPTETIALDARLRVSPAPPNPARLAILPYPRELETTAVLRDSSAVNLRPVRPEDEPLLQDLATHMSPEDLRLRFFTTMKGLSHQLAARLVQIDYDREIALLALAAADGAALGVARFVADPDKYRAEYAVAVRTDWQGRGLGYLLMARLIEVARSRGVGELFGEVLRENAAMLQMCRALGFAVRTDPDDPALMRVAKRLSGRVEG